MKVYSWKEMNLAVTDLLNSIPKGTTSKDIIWIEVSDKIRNLSLDDGVEWGYNFFSTDVANLIIKKYLEEKFK
jgi:hypothetical protein